MPAGWPALGTIVADVVFTAAAMNAVYEYGVQRYQDAAGAAPRQVTVRLAGLTPHPAAGGHDSRSGSSH